VPLASAERERLERVARKQGISPEALALEILNSWLKYR
jgi:hypothetical protein